MIFKACKFWVCQRWTWRNEPKIGFGNDNKCTYEKYLREKNAMKLWEDNPENIDVVKPPKLKS